MVDSLTRFTSLEPVAPAAKGRAAPSPKPEARPEPGRSDGVDVRLSAEARALLDQIAAARGGTERKDSGRPAPPGSRVNVVV